MVRQNQDTVVFNGMIQGQSPLKLLALITECQYMK